MALELVARLDLAELDAARPLVSAPAPMRARSNPAGAPRRGEPPIIGDTPDVIEAAESRLPPHLRDFLLGA